MSVTTTYQKFPWWIVLLSNLVSISIYFFGSFIMLQLGWISMGIYLAFLLILEYRLLSKHCVHCYYWGKICGFGKGRISALFFSKGDSAKFCAKEFTWMDMIPDLLVSLIPFIVAVILLITTRFNLILLIALLLLGAFSTAGSGYIRSSLTCKYCKQRELGCPADELFNRGK